MEKEMKRKENHVYFQINDSTLAEAQQINDKTETIE
jgi:hypothetical protein